MKILGKIILTIVTIIASGFAGLFLLAWIACGGGFDSGGAFLTIIMIVVIFFAIKGIWKKAGGSKNEIIIGEKYIIGELNSNQKMMIDYVKTSWMNGLNNEQIRNNLKNEGGWSKEDIDDIFLLIKNARDK